MNEDRRSEPATPSDGVVASTADADEPDADDGATNGSRPIPAGAVCVLIPTLNEAATIGSVIDGFVDRGYTDVLVVDGDSDDDTRDIARDRGARVITQSGAGKGQAVREGLAHVDAPYVLMLDGDGTYDPADADRMLEPLSRGYDHVIGNRFAEMEEDAMRRLNGIGNRLINGAFRFIHGAAYDDILSGYRAFSAASVGRLSLESDGFSLETELAVECVKHDLDTAVVPITYRARPDDSETNLHPIRDGGTIILTLYSLAKTNNPLFYFGSLGSAGILSGLAIGIYVLFEYLRYGISHEILALVSAAGVLLGVQLLMFGVLSDMIVALHREQRRRLERIAREPDAARERAPSRVGDARTAADREVTPDDGTEPTSRTGVDRDARSDRTGE